MVERRRVSAAYRDFDQEIRRLGRLDDVNHVRYYPGPGRPSADRLSASQMHLLTEAIFTRAFSKYESFLEQIFLLYCQGKRSISGATIGSYILPKNAKHAKSIIKSGMTFLEWNTPDRVIDRCETYLYPDNPIYLAMISYQSRLQVIRRIRNAIAHLSEESDVQFRKSIRAELGVTPLKHPTVGEFLLMIDRGAAQRQHYLKSYLDILSEVARISAA